MQEMQAQLLQNPEQMQSMLNSLMMESILNNPELMCSFMMGNLQLRQMMEQNPEIAHIFNDQATFRQMMRMARNPSLMNKMMRNTDRQMANIEMMPVGFDDPWAPQNTANNTTLNPNANINGAATNPFASLFPSTANSNNLNAFLLPNMFGNTVTGTGTGVGAGAGGNADGTTGLLIFWGGGRMP